MVMIRAALIHKNNIQNIVIIREYYGWIKKLKLKLMHLKIKQMNTNINCDIIIS